MNANNNINIQSEEKARVIDLIRTNDPNYKANEEVPMLFSNCTNWQGRPFMRLTEFVNRVTEHLNFYNQALMMAKDHYSFNKLDLLDTELRAQVEIFI